LIIRARFIWNKPAAKHEFCKTGYPENERQQFKKASPFIAILNWFFLHPDWPFWVLPFAVIAHQVEEYIYPGGFREWFNRAILGSTDANLPLTKALAFWINIPLFWTALIITAVIGSGNLWITMPVVSIVFVNAWLHIAFAIAMNASPGVSTAMLVLLPLTSYIYYYFLITWNMNFVEFIVPILIAVVIHMLFVSALRRRVVSPSKES
jgi:hypothetical protein